MNVLPDPSSFDVADDRAANAKSIRDGLLRAAGEKNSYRLRLCEFGFVVRLATACPSFGISIGHVLKLSAQPKMSEIDAVSDIAGVAHAKTLWDRAVRLHPYEPVGEPYLPLPSDSGIPTERAPRPKTASVAVGRRCEMRKPLRERPVTRELKLFTVGDSHLLAPSQQHVVRAGADAPTSPGPSFIAENVMKSRAAEGLFTGMSL